MIAVLHDRVVLAVDIGDVLESAWSRGRLDGSQIAGVTTDARAVDQADEVIELSERTLVPGTDKVDLGPVR